MIDRFLEPLAQPEFIHGLRFGTGAAALAGLAAVLAGQRRRPVGMLGVVALPAVLLALAAPPAGVPPTGARLAVAAALLGGAGVLAGLLGRSAFWTLPLALVAASVLAAEFDALAGYAVLLAVVAAVSAPGVFDVDRQWPGLAPTLVAVSAGGIYATVPDTEVALVVLGAYAPLAVLGWPLRAAALGPLAPALIVPLLWAVAAGGSPRPASLVGGAACVGLLAVEPWWRWARRSAGSLRPYAMEILVVVHVAAVLVASRLAGLQTEVTAAAVLAGAALMTAAVVAPAVSSTRRR